MRKNRPGTFGQALTTIALLAGIIALDLSHAAASQDWRPRAEKDGVQTWTKKIEGSKYHAVRGETILNSTVARLVAVINDAAACIEWADLCAKSFVQEQVTSREAYIYTLNDMPWPVKDREVLAHVKWMREGNRVEMQSEAIPGRIDASKGIVRIAQARATWQFTPTEDGRVHAVFEIHMDPNGAIPGWLLNRLVLNSPFNTFSSLEKQARKEKYAGSTLPF